MNTYSPCLEPCQLNGVYCLSCSRRIDEIAQWTAFSESKRQKIMADLPQRSSLWADNSRKGYSRMSDIPLALREELSRGHVQAKSLVETLAIDFATLLDTVFNIKTLSFKDQGIVKRMQLAAEMVVSTRGFDKALAQTRLHRSDTIRGIGAYVVGLNPELDLRQRLNLIEDFAADFHSGVREWAWMAVRPHLVLMIEESLNELIPWVKSSNYYLRRFATEVTRPRGVWTAHIQKLKENPALGLELLTYVKADPEKYVQNSVANWLNDAAKSHPDWVVEVCSQWQRNNNDATIKICKRALRSLKK